MNYDLGLKLKSVAAFSCDPPTISHTHSASLSQTPSLLVFVSHSQLPTARRGELSVDNSLRFSLLLLAWAQNRKSPTRKKQLNRIEFGFCKLLVGFGSKTGKTKSSIRCFHGKFPNRTEPYGLLWITVEFGNLSLSTHGPSFVLGLPSQTGTQKLCIR